MLCVWSGADATFLHPDTHIPTLVHTRVCAHTHTSIASGTRPIKLATPTPIETLAVFVFCRPVPCPLLLPTSQPPPPSSRSCMCAGVFVCVCVGVCGRVWACARACARVLVCLYICVRARACVHARAGMLIYLCVNFFRYGLVSDDLLRKVSTQPSRLRNPRALTLMFTCGNWIRFDDTAASTTPSRYFMSNVAPSSWLLVMVPGTKVPLCVCVYVCV